MPLESWNKTYWCFGLWQMTLGVLNEYMVVHKQNNASWLPRTVHVVQPVHTSMYLVCTEYIPVCTWIAKIIRGYYVFTFDNGKRYCVYETGTWWCLKSKTVPDFMAIIHVIIPVHTEYIPVHTGMYHFQGYWYVPECTRYRPVHTGMYQKPWFRTTGHDSRCCCGDLRVTV